MNMKTCKICGKVKHYSLNFIFSASVCNDCYLVLREYQTENAECSDSIDFDELRKQEQNNEKVK